MLRATPFSSTCSPRKRSFPGCVTACSCTPVHPLNGAGCAARCAERWPGPRCSRGGAGDLDEAEVLAAAGGVDFAPNHHHDAVGPMTGIITRACR